MSWQPIETAPKDGTFVFLRGTISAPFDPFWRDKKKAKWVTKVFGLVRVSNAYWDEASEEITHWMPLPPLPEGDER